MPEAPTIGQSYGKIRSPLPLDKLNGWLRQNLPATADFGDVKDVKQFSVSRSGVDGAMRC